MQKYINAQDGEYCIKIDEEETLYGTRIYCHDISSDSPKEYISLPAEPEENFVNSWHHNSNRMHGDVYFEKLRLDVSVNSISIHTNQCYVDHLEN